MYGLPGGADKSAGDIAVQALGDVHRPGREALLQVRSQECSQMKRSEPAGEDHIESRPFPRGLLNDLQGLGHRH